jgi:hypothetical protein
LLDLVFTIVLAKQDCKKERPAEDKAKQACKAYVEGIPNSLTGALSRRTALQR